MQIVESKRFQKQVKQLPKSVGEQVQKQLELLRDNPRHPSLHFKKLAGKSDTYSIRVAKSYRALFILTDEACIFFAVGHRKDVYR